jgi:hypothetical protein
MEPWTEDMYDRKIISHGKFTDHQLSRERHLGAIERNVMTVSLQSVYFHILVLGQQCRREGRMEQRALIYMGVKIIKDDERDSWRP